MSETENKVVQINKVIKNVYYIYSHNIEIFYFLKPVINTQ